MKRLFLSVILGSLLGCTVSAHAEPQAEEILKAIVKVRAVIPTDARTAGILGTEREGSGVVIDSVGHVLTIGYLILEAETIEVTGPEGDSITSTFVGYDDRTGFGLLRTNRPLNVVPMELGQSSELKEGDPILIAGYGGANSVQGARVISRRQFPGYWEYLLEDAIFTSPPYVHFAGAALIGPGGRLVGIGSLFVQVSIPGVRPVPSNMFVPIDLLRPILADLITTGRSSEPPRPWLGMNADEAHGRVFITQVTSGGPAERGGIKAGDMILKVDKTAVEGLADFYRKVWALGKAGISVPLTLLRGTEIEEMTVNSGDRHQFLGLRPKRR
jgi:S1-C subfamily serine protease